MHRFYLPRAQPAAAENGPTPPSFFLGGREAHHALHVLRLRRGEQLIVLDGEGNQYTGEVEAYDRDKLKMRVLESKFVPRRPWRLTLVQALPKGKLIESIIQKATELGVDRVVPVSTERTVLHVKPGEAMQKQLKWQAVAIEAIKQCGSAWLPRVDRPLALKEFLQRGEIFELPMVGSLEPGSRHARDCFESFQKNHGRMPASVCFFVGPEGDFSPAEYEALLKAGAMPITLGPLVLRTETAAVYCLSVAQYELQFGLPSG